MATRRAEVDRRRWTLDQVPALAELPAADRRALQDVAAVFFHERGQPVYVEGDRADAVHLVLTGLVELIHRHGDPHESAWSFVRTGEVFGEGAFLSQSRRDHRAVTLADALICVLEVAPLESALREHPRIAVTLTRMLLRQTGAASNRLIETLGRPVRERLLGTLCDLARAVGRPTGSGGVVLDARLTHRGLAAYIGAARETVSAALIHLRAEGLVTQEGRRIVLSSAAQAR